MDKMSTVFSSFSDITWSSEKHEKRGAASADSRGEERRGVKTGWNMLLTRDQLFDIYSGTAKTPEKEKEKSDILSLHAKSQALLDLGNLEYSTKKKEEALGSWAHYKIGLTKMLHNYNIIYSKFYRDLTKDVQEMNRASNLSHSSPKNLMDSVHGVMGSMRSFISMLQPMAQVMGKMNEVNLTIMTLGRELGPEGANRVFGELSAKIQSYDNLPGSTSSVGRTSEKANDELMVGKFYQDWTAQSLQQGVETLKYATDSMDRHCKKLKNLGMMGKEAQAVKTKRKEDDHSFSLPTTFALKGHDKEEQEKKQFSEVEQSISDFREASQIEVPELMSNEMLKDPYLLASESIAQASLGKEVTGLDESQRISSAAHTSMF
jgi:hypothetical protein